MKLGQWYNRNHKKLLVLPALILALSLIYLVFFYVQTGDVILKDVSLTGGTTVSFKTQLSPSDFQEKVSGDFPEFEVKAISDNAGNQMELVLTVKETEGEDILKKIGSVLGYELAPEDYSIEVTSSSLSGDFYKQLIIAVILAFFWMSAVVFIIFTDKLKTKIKVVVINLLFGFFMGKFFLSSGVIVSGLVFLIFAVLLIRIYIKNSVPAFAVMLSAFADIVITLAIVDFVGMEVSTAGIVAFLTLIGYSVDTDVLLTTRALKNKEGLNKTLVGAFKTGITMTLTSIVAIAAALIVVYPFGSVLNQIFIILLIGLCFDIFNTWVTNASIIKWYLEKNENHN